MFTGQPSGTTPALRASQSPVASQVISKLALNLTPFLWLVGDPPLYEGDKLNVVRWFDHNGSARVVSYEEHTENIDTKAPFTGLEKLLKHVETQLIYDVRESVTTDSTVGASRRIGGHSQQDVMRLLKGRDLILTGDKLLYGTIISSMVGAQEVTENYHVFNGPSLVHVVYIKHMNSDETLLLNTSQIEVVIPVGYGISIGVGEVPEIPVGTITTATKIWGTCFGDHLLLTPKGA